jgi:hypothetical protein
MFSPYTYKKYFDIVKDKLGNTERWQKVIDCRDELQTEMAESQ